MLSRLWVSDRWASAVLPAAVMEKMGMGLCGLCVGLIQAAKVDVEPGVMPTSRGLPRCTQSGACDSGVQGKKCVRATVKRDGHSG